MRPLWLGMALALLLPAVAAALELGDQWRLGGHLKSLNLGTRAPERSELDDVAASANRLRLDLRGASADDWQAEVSIEGLLLARKPAGQTPLPGVPASRIAPLTWNGNEDGALAHQLQIDRLALAGRRGDWGWSLGRQAIGFGRIGLYSPLDVIAPFPPDALDTEVRPGIDALRLSHFSGMAGQLDIIAAFGDGPDRHSQLASLTANAAETDLLLLGGNLLDRPVLGAGVAGQLQGIGLKAELVGYRGASGDLHEHFAVGGIETDFRLPGDQVVFLQYLYNGAGAREPADYPRAAASAFVRDGLGFLAGRHYLLAGPSWQWHPLASTSLLAIVNLADGSALLRPLLELSLSDNAALQLFCTVNTGSGPDGTPSRPTSEFGGQGPSLGLLLKYFF